MKKVGGVFLKLHAAAAWPFRAARAAWYLAAATAAWRWWAAEVGAEGGPDVPRRAGGSARSPFCRCGRDDAGGAVEVAVEVTVDASLAGRGGVLRLASGVSMGAARGYAAAEAVAAEADRSQRRPPRGWGRRGARAVAGLGHVDYGSCSA